MVSLWLGLKLQEVIWEPGTVELKVGGVQAGD